jgi:hypothetical protein
MEKNFTYAVKWMAFLCRIEICFLIVFSLSLTANGQQNTQPLTIEEIIQNISAEFSLTNQEQLILQPVLNEIAVFYKARNALSYQMHV